MQNKVSIIIPYKLTRPEQFNHLREAIDSALAQTYSNMEIITICDEIPILRTTNCRCVIDDNDAVITGNTLNSLNTIYDYVFNHKIININTSEGNRGVSAARNLGIEYASGKYILCLDHDDILESTAVEKMVSELDKEEFDIVGCWYTQFWEDKPNKKLKTIKQNTDSNYFIFTYGLSITSMFKKEHWNKCGGFNTDSRCKVEDTDFFLRMIRINDCKIKVLQGSLFYYRKYTKYKSRNSALSEQETKEMIVRMNNESVLLFERKALFLAEQARLYLNKSNHLEKINQRLNKKWKIGQISIIFNIFLIGVLISTLLKE